MNASQRVDAGHRRHRGRRDRGARRRRADAARPALDLVPRRRARAASPPRPVDVRRRSDARRSRARPDRHARGEALRRARGRRSAPSSPGPAARFAIAREAGDLDRVPPRQRERPERRLYACSSRRASGSSPPTTPHGAERDGHARRRRRDASPSSGATRPGPGGRWRRCSRPRTARSRRRSRSSRARTAPATPRAAGIAVGLSPAARSPAGMKLLAAVAASRSSFAAPRAGARRYAVGLVRGADADAVAARLERRASRASTSRSARSPSRPTTAPAARSPASRGSSGSTRSRRLAFTPADPLVPRQWYLEQVRAFDVLGGAAAARGPARRRDRLRDRRRASGVPRTGSPPRGASSAAAATTDQQGHGTFVAGVIAALHDAKGTAGIAFGAKLLVGKVVRADGTVSLEAEVAGDPLGRRQRRARDQPQPRRRPRPAQPGARHVLAARGRRGRVRGRPGRGRRRGRRQRRPGAEPAVAVRELPRRAPARHRRQRARPATARSRTSPTATGSSTTSPRPGRTSSRPTRARCRQPGCVPAGLLRLRPGGLPARRGHVVRRAAGLAAPPRCSCPCDPALTPDQVVVPPRRGPRWTRTPSTGCRECPLGRDQLARLGPARRHRGDRAGDVGADPACRPARDRTTTPASRPARSTARAAAASRRRSTSGTTRPTSTRPPPRRAAALRLPVRPGRGASSPSGGPGRRTVEGLSLRVQRHAAHAARARAAPRSASPSPRRGDARPGLVLRAGEARRPRGGAVHARVREALTRRYWFSSSSSSGHLAQHARGVADDDRPRRDVLRHDRAGADERLLADLDPRAEHRAAADPGAAADRRALHVPDAASRCGPCSCRSSSRTHGAMKTCSSSVEYAVM